MSGKLIVLEGIDGAGTTTQCAAAGAGTSACVTSRASPRTATDRQAPPPASCATSVARRRRARDGALFAADRLDHSPARSCRSSPPADVITDRYVMSSMRLPVARRRPRSFVAEINRLARPADLTLLVDVDVEVAESRRRGAAAPRSATTAAPRKSGVAAAYRAEAAASRRRHRRRQRRRRQRLRRARAARAKLPRRRP